jgi:FdhE protein
MPYLAVTVPLREELLAGAERRWAALMELRPDLGPAVELQRRLLTLVINLTHTIENGRLPRLSLPPKYLAAKLAKGVPALAGEPIPLPTALLKTSLLRFCDELASGGAGEAAEHIRAAIESGNLDAGSLLTASLGRDQTAIRTGAVHRGLSPDLVWLVAELAVGPVAHALQRMLLANTSSPELRGALENWNQGYCPACGSWPALAESSGGHRLMRCSLCACGWELRSYTCVYCGESGPSFITAAPNEERKDRRIEACRACGAYLKTVEVAELSPFPLLAIADLETMDLDVAAMDHGYARPAMKEFSKRR